MNNYNIAPFVFYRSLSQANRTREEDYEKTVYFSEDISEKIEYKINSHGYRSEKFEKNNEVLVLGCSQTHGSGLPNEFTWPEVFSRYINKKYSRIADRGDSIGGQVYKAFKYFEEIGNPEIVVALFPLYRLEYIAVPDKFLSSSQTDQGAIKNSFVGMAYFYEEYSLKISKAPHDPKYIIPQEFVIFYNFMFIKMLEQYCESNGIKFIWSIYDNDGIAVYMESIPQILKNYIKTSECIKDFDYLKKEKLEKLSEDDNKNKIKHEVCCKEFKNHKLYSWASDFDKKKKLGHWGIHIHQHMAELFINRYREIKND